MQKIGDGEAPQDKKYSGNFNTFSLHTEPYFQKTHTHQRSFLYDSMATDKHKLTIWTNWKKDLESQGLLLRSFLPLSEDFNFENSLAFCPILSDS